MKAKFSKHTDPQAMRPLTQVSRREILRSGRRFLVLVACACVLPTLAIAQKWQAISLHPGGGYGSSYATAASGGTQVGLIKVDGVSHAAKWSGTSRSFVDMHPTQPLAKGSDGNAADGTTVVGTANGHAGLWTEGPNSFTDLNPPEASWSIANGAANGMQVGLVSFGGPNGFACAWFGTAASFFYLDPGLQGVTSSRAIATDGVQVGGLAIVNDMWHAILWTGPNCTPVELTPAVAETATIDGVHNGEQTGTVVINGIAQASLWKNTKTSWVNLHPPAVLSSQAYGIHLGQQVGYTKNYGESMHAAFWEGSKETWVDLQAALPRRYAGSIAWGISHDDRYIYVVGHANNSKTGVNEAMLWKRRR